MQRNASTNLGISIADVELFVNSFYEKIMNKITENEIIEINSCIISPFYISKSTINEILIARSVLFVTNHT